MMINLKKIRNVIYLFIAAASLCLGQSALAEGGGHTVGNGGGSWVCREMDGKIRWLKLVDLFEATDEYGLALAEYHGTVSEILEQVRSRLDSADRDLFNSVAPYLRELNNLEPNPPYVVHTSHIVQTIDDSLYRIKPAPSECAGGTVNYEQVVNYKNDGYILVESELVKALPNDVRAALVLHEAIYKYRRDVAGDTDSVITRRIVGLIFSKISSGSLREALSSLGERELGNLGMKFSLIQPATFMMGHKEGGGYENVFTKAPQHQVTLTKEFEIQTTTVTQSQYALVMGVNPSAFKELQHCPKTHEVRLGIAMCPDNPVDSVSFDDVQAFITKFNKIRLDGYTYRLPTEAEWEYSARAGTTSVFYFGNDYSVASNYGWFDPEAGWHTHEVAELKPNSFGLYDMSGNISQWVSDWYDGFGTTSLTDPAGPSSGYWRVVRPGGCYGNNIGVGAWARSGDFQSSYARGYVEPRLHLYCVGFRLVRTQK